jgi:ribosomal protein S18 acetylase RimI-like enzyme
MHTVGDIPNTQAMVPVTDGSQIAQAIRQVRQGGRGFVTNFFAGRKQIESWVSRNALSCLRTGRCLWILRRDRDFQHLFYFAADVGALDEGLKALNEARNGAILAIDLVGRRDDVRSLADLFRGHGFADQAVLIRMSRQANSNLPDESDRGEVGFAGPADAPAILELLERLFDRFSKQIPDLDEIRDAISRNSILVCRQGMAIAGLLFFETAGLTSTLRYWCVDATFREQRVGSRLITSFFRVCRASKSIVLWVYAENDNAIRRYRHYGFQDEETVDQILICR